MMLLKNPPDQAQIEYLRKTGILHPDEGLISSEKAGEGNMNVTLKINTEKRSIVLKQSRDYVVKYPQVPAPRERTGIEYAYYKVLSKNKLLAGYSPKILAFDQSNWLMAMEFLQNGKDYLSIYKQPELLDVEQVNDLLLYLKNLHQIAPADFPENRAMRELNHQHIFVLPYQKDNGFDLDQVQPGLQDLSEIIKKDKALLKKIDLLGERYLGPGTCLIHGDFYPGSWLQTARGMKVIDAEFAFMGDPEFDLGVMLAHLKMAVFRDDTIDKIIGSYPLNSHLLAQYTGVEILRRIFGLAQLPLSLSLAEKETLGQHAIHLLINEKF
ncbi:5-methylthioribose kinase [Cyclobacterium lianum]|uniref:5-methylthioribose kinase n=1 Tax=Cyclobacterium lianum TaxID=388280 RepID=A0A1M7QTP0_9BACT|nr:phosphotransferase [Cyclobacterium lianum]SHN35200.1 5-methylthioribose kinase [Cyclobacterium lianum]